MNKRMLRDLQLFPERDRLYYGVQAALTVNDMSPDSGTGEPAAADGVAYIARFTDPPTVSRRVLCATIEAPPLPC